MGLRRKRPTLTSRPRFLVVCEGRKSEPTYFEDLRKSKRLSSAVINVDDESGEPKSLVERAVALKLEAQKEAKRSRDPSIAYEEVWCVFDVDAHPRLPDAQQQALAHGIHLAISNPCFELWIAIHFCDQNAHIDRKAILRVCEHCIPGYAKGATFRQLEPHYANALARAIRLSHLRATQGNAGGNPSTDVHLLSERLRKLEIP